MFQSMGTFLSAEEDFQLSNHTLTVLHQYYCFILMCSLLDCDCGVLTIPNEEGLKLIVSVMSLCLLKHYVKIQEYK